MLLMVMTGPILVFETSLYVMATNLGLDTCNYMTCELYAMTSIKPFTHSTRVDWLVYLDHCVDARRARGLVPTQVRHTLHRRHFLHTHLGDFHRRSRQVYCQGESAV